MRGEIRLNRGGPRHQIHERGLMEKILVENKVVTPDQASSLPDDVLQEKHIEYTNQQQRDYKTNG